MTNKFEIVEGYVWCIATKESLKLGDVVRACADEHETFNVTDRNYGVLSRFAELGLLFVMRKQEKKLVVTLEIPVKSIRCVGVTMPWAENSCSLSVEWYGGQIDLQGSYESLCAHSSMLREAIDSTKG